MKRTLILLFLLCAVTSFGVDLTGLLKDQHIDLASGVQLPPPVKYNDFSNITSSSKPVSISVWGENLINPSISEGWYRFDFAEDPFNGLIEIAVVGQPSASVNATLIISCLLGYMLFYKRKQLITRLPL